MNFYIYYSLCANDCVNSTLLHKQKDLSYYKMRFMMISALKQILQPVAAWIFIKEEGKD